MSRPKSTTRRHTLGNHKIGVTRCSVRDNYGLAWEKKVRVYPEKDLEPYTREDMWFDQMEQLPSEEQVHVLIELLRSPEVAEMAEGVINDTTAACKVGDTLEVAKAINSWIATAEEMVTNRGTRRNILAARDRIRRQRRQAQETP